MDANITNPRMGFYCFALGGIGITPANAVPVVSLDWSDTSTAPRDNVIAVVTPASHICPAGRIGVLTFDATSALSPAGFTIAFM